MGSNPTSLCCNHFSMVVLPLPPPAPRAVFDLEGALLVLRPMLVRALSLVTALFFFFLGITPLLSVTPNGFAPQMGNGSLYAVQSCRGLSVRTLPSFFSVVPFTVSPAFSACSPPFFFFACFFVPPPPGPSRVTPLIVLSTLVFFKPTPCGVLW